jgi:hypothetical protein
MKLPDRKITEHIERPPRDGQIILREYKRRE